jgi:transcriptional regulator with XRE-family HTH domain
MTLPDFAVNLRRLLAWHGLSSADLAKLLGATEASVSGWVTGKREPSGKYLKAPGDLFEIKCLRRSVTRSSSGWRSRTRPGTPKWRRTSRALVVGGWKLSDGSLVARPPLDLLLRDLAARESNPRNISIGRRQRRCLRTFDFRIKDGPQGFGWIRSTWN